MRVWLRALHSSVLVPYPKYFVAEHDFVTFNKKRKSLRYKPSVRNEAFTVFNWFDLKCIILVSFYGSWAESSIYTFIWREFQFIQLLYDVS